MYQKGTVLYARCVQTNGEISSNAVTSKSRVAPLKSTRISRMELCGAALGLNSEKSMKNVLKVDMREVTLRAGSVNVLHWICN